MSKKRGSSLNSGKAQTPSRPASPAPAATPSAAAAAPGPKPLKFAALALIAISFLAFIAWEVNYINKFGNDVMQDVKHEHDVLHDPRLTDITDPHSESDVLRAADGFHQQGFWFNYGLPDHAFGNQYPQFGCKWFIGYWAGELRKQGKPVDLDAGIDMPQEAFPIKGNSWVYTHYPSLIDWTVYLLSLILGFGKIVLFRYFMVAIGVCAVGWLTWILCKTLGPGRAFFIVAPLLLAPTMRYWMPGLTNQSYSGTILIAEVAAALLILEVRRRIEWQTLALLWAIAFIHGWNSFDYFFLTALAAVPFWFFQARREGRIGLKGLALLVAVPTAGYMTAMGLHFVQVILYRHGLRAAITDYAHVGAYRSSGEVAWLDIHLTAILKRYFEAVTIDPRFFGHQLSVVACVALLLTLVRRLRLRLAGWRVGWESTWLDAAGLASALVITLLWIMKMRNHSAWHLYFIARHFVFFYICLLYYIVKGIRIEPLAVNGTLQSAGASR